MIGVPRLPHAPCLVPAPSSPCRGGAHAGDHSEGKLTIRRQDLSRGLPRRRSAAALGCRGSPLATPRGGATTGPALLARVRSPTCRVSSPPYHGTPRILRDRSPIRYASGMDTSSGPP